MVEHYTIHQSKENYIFKDNSQYERKNANKDNLKIKNKILLWMIEIVMIVH